MEFLYSPRSRCEKSSYDSLWRRVPAKSRGDGIDENKNISLSDIYSFLREYGFYDEKILAQLQELADDGTVNPAGEKKEITDRNISKERFYTIIRAVSILQRSPLHNIALSDISDTKSADIPLFRCDNNCYRPSSACERSAYESLWFYMNDLRSPVVDGSRVVKFAVKSGLTKDTLSKCWTISLDDSGSHSMQKDQFFVFLRCVSFVQTTGIVNITKQHITSTADRDFPLPNFADDEFTVRARLATKYPAAFYFPQTKFEIQAYHEFWIKATKSASSASKVILDDADLTCSDVTIGAVEAVTFVVTSRLQRSILKAVWTICSPSAGPVGDTRLSREQFNVLLRGISFAQQFPMQALTADAISSSALLDLKLPCFEFADSDVAKDVIPTSPTPKGPRPPAAPLKQQEQQQQQQAVPIPSDSSSQSQSPDSRAILVDVSSPPSATGTPIKAPVLNEDLMNAAYLCPPPPMGAHTLTPSRARSLGSTPKPPTPGPSRTVPLTVPLPPARSTSIGSIPLPPPMLGSAGAGRASSISGPLLNSDDMETIPGRSMGSGQASACSVVGGLTPSEDIHTSMCVCGDMVERFKQDCVRLRCKCLIHTGCLALYIKSQLADSTSISGEGIRCCYWHSCHSFITMDDVDKFSTFIGRAATSKDSSSASLSSPGGAAQGSAPGDNLNFGSSEVDKFTRFAVAASFEEKDLVYCPSCSTPFWVDEEFTVRRVVCLNAKCGVHFCRSCQVQWHAGIDCSTYQIKVASADKLSHRYVAATSKQCPSCTAPFTHYHGHSCHHISPVGAKGGGCPQCHVHFCYACLSTAEENIAVRGDRKACKCPKGKWSTFCESVDINRFLIQDPYPHDSRCGCPICPDCRYQKPCGGLGYSGSSCDGTCVVCLGLAPPGPLEILDKPTMKL